MIVNPFSLGDSELSNAGEGDDAGSITAATSMTSGTVYSLIETAHPVFGKVKRLWNSSVESHREVCVRLFCKHVIALQHFNIIAHLL